MANENKENYKGIDKIKGMVIMFNKIHCNLNTSCFNCKHKCVNKIFIKKDK